MITEAEEQKTYLEVKNRYAGEKGKIIFIEASDWDFTSPKVYHLQTLQEMRFKISEHYETRGCYAIFDYTETAPVFAFQGKTFSKEEEIFTGKITRYQKEQNPRPSDMGKVKEQFKLLGEILRNSKASQL